MTALKRLVLFVEGKGDIIAAPALIGKLLSELQASDPAVFLDSKPLRVGGVTSLFGKKEKNWTDNVRVAAKRGNLGGVLLLQDGDVQAWPGKSFCACDVGQGLRTI